MTNRKRYDEQLLKVHEKLKLFLEKIEIAINNTIEVLMTNDCELANNTIANDRELNELESDIESECLKLLLFETPVATDFRRVSSALKMITDLERIGDQASDICSIVITFEKDYSSVMPSDIPKMAKKTFALVQNSVYSYLNSDLELAKSLDDQDDEIDKLFDKVKDELVFKIKENSDNADSAIYYMMIAKYIERIGDHAVNIGEWVDYALTGEHKKHNIF